MQDETAGPPPPWTSQDSPQGARAAATLIVLRDSPGGAPPQALMVQRSSAMAFAGGAIVFPGGRVDPADIVLAECLPHDLPLQDAAARIAAIRETIEEAGVAIGLSPVPTAEALGAIRAGLHGGLPFGAVLTEHGLTVDLAALTPFARWCPGRAESHVPRVFDTRFYVARAPEGGPLATVDATENVRLRWASAAQVLADCDVGREVAIYPTRRNLERLALGGSYAAVVAHALAHPPEMVTPWKEMRGGEAHLCIPDHLGYPVTSQALATLRRG
ncbi:MAG: NUDIX domain-containing protein [Sphingobium sp.]